MRGSVALLLAVVGSLIAMPRAQADSLSVYVGYADTLRAGGFVPGPSCSTFGPACQVEQGVALDGGVFLIQNRGANQVTITNITVTLNSGANPTTLALWSDVTVAPGGSATFGQTSQWDFDTSDYSFLNSNPGASLNGVGGCTTPSALSAVQETLCSANLPVISFDENGNPVTIVDAGSVLNTGGFDMGLAGNNESENWSLAGTVSTTPEPGSLTLLGIGMIGLADVIRRRRKG